MKWQFYSTKNYGSSEGKMGSDSVVLLSCTFYKVMGSECIILLIFGISYDQTCSDRPECFPVFKYFYVLYQNFRLEC